MTVYMLIRALQKQPPHLEVTVWDHDEDENMPVVQVFYEDGTSEVSLLTRRVKTVTVAPNEHE
jgi:hypothetical protein